MKKKLLTMLLASVMILSCLAGCGKTGDSGEQSTVAQQPSTSEGEEKEPVTIYVNEWPKDESKVTEIENMNRLRDSFQEKYPWITVESMPWDYDAKTYLAQASSGQVPTMYHIFFTEVDRVINAGFAKDCTALLQEFGWFDLYTDQMKELCMRDGKMYLFPYGIYSMGLQINRNVFEAAGLVNADGTVMIPETYDEVLEFSKIIKEKTGAYGFLTATKGAGGGWHFINLAWSFGVNFMEKVDGKWKATFDSPEMVAALQYLKDMKFEHGLMPEEIIMSGTDICQLFATDQLGMSIAEPLTGDVINLFGFDKNNLVYASLPEGQGGRYSQVGGSLKVIDRNATDAQAEACMLWLDHIGRGPSLTESAKVAIISDQAIRNEKNLIVGIKPLSVFKDEAEVCQYRYDIIKQMQNVDPKNFEHYALNKATLRAEEPVNCAELYQLMSSMIQEVLSSKDSNVEEVVKKAAADFQANSLDGSNY